VIADDWIPTTQEASSNPLADRLEAAAKDIIVLHDPEPQTATMLPAFLRYLRDNRYRVVHVISKESAGQRLKPDGTKNVNNSNNLCGICNAACKWFLTDWNAGRVRWFVVQG
jgi:hypothetical protein